MTIPTPTIVAGIEQVRTRQPISNRAAKPATSPTPTALRGWSSTASPAPPSNPPGATTASCICSTPVSKPSRSTRCAPGASPKQLAKNDRVDASMLARYGVAGTPPKAPILHRLNDLIAIRRKHVAQRAAQLKLHSQWTPAPPPDPLKLFDEQ